MVAGSSSRTVPPEIAKPLAMLKQRKEDTERFIAETEASMYSARANLVNNITAGKPGNLELVSGIIAQGELILLQSREQLETLNKEIEELTTIANTLQRGKNIEAKFISNQKAAAAARAAAAKLKEEQNAAAALAAAQLEEEKVTAYEKANPSVLAGILSSVPPPSAKPISSLTVGGRRRKPKTRRSKKSRKQTRRRR